MNRHFVEGLGIILREVLMRGDEPAVIHAVDRGDTSTIKGSQSFDRAICFRMIYDHIILPWPTLSLRWHSAGL